MYDLIVIGAGPAGLEAASEAVTLGLSAAVVSDMPTGGRSAMGSLLPGKVWLHAEAGASDAQEITRSISRVQGEWVADRHGELLASGVDLLRGRGVLVDPGCVEVHETEADREAVRVEGRAVIVATGSEPSFVNEVKPDGVRIIAPRHTQKLSEIPDHVVVVGGGITGTEYANAFARLGSRVEIVIRGSRVLPYAEAEAGAFIGSYLSQEYGVRIHRNRSVTSLESRGEHVVTSLESTGPSLNTGESCSLESSYVFIATGRRADLSPIDEAPVWLRDRFLRTSEGALKTDAWGRTSVSPVYAVGDATGAPLTANKAQWQARLAVRSIAGTVDEALPPESELIQAVYTDPQVAWIGPVAELPSDGDGSIGIRYRSLGKLLLARIEGVTGGFLKIWYERESGRILGASAAGKQAAELLVPVQLAMNNGISLSRLTDLPAPHPTYAELLTQIHP